MSGSILGTKANELALMINIKIFNCSEGWLAHFKHQNNFVYKTVYGGGAVDLAVCNEFYKKLSEQNSAYVVKDVLNANDIGLLYKLLPNKTNI